jgi:hypothetical protein
VKEDFMSKLKAEPTFFQKIISALKDNLIIVVGTMIATIVATILATIGFFLSPLRDKLFTLVWDEKIETVILPEDKDEIFENQILTIKVKIINSSPIESKDFIISWEFSDLKVAKKEGLDSSKTIKSLTSGEIKDLEIKVRTLKKGMFKLVVKLKTARGKETFVMEKFNVRKSDLKGKIPSERDFSGTWLVSVGKLNGKMQIEEKDLEIKGGFKIDDGKNRQTYIRKGEITSGIKDGGTITMQLSFGKNKPYWDIKANHKKEGDFLKIYCKEKDCAKYYDARNKLVKSEDFSASASIETIIKY